MLSEISEKHLLEREPRNIGKPQDVDVRWLMEELRLGEKWKTLDFVF